MEIIILIILAIVGLLMAAKGKDNCDNELYACGFSIAIFSFISIFGCIGVLIHR